MHCEGSMMRTSNRVGPLQNALVTPGARGQPELQGEHPGVEGGQVVPLLSTRNHLQHRPRKHLDSESFPKTAVYLSKHS